VRKLRPPAPSCIFCTRTATSAAALASNVSSSVTVKAFGLA
jgi:hypothetical protein